MPSKYNNKAYKKAKRYMNHYGAVNKTKLTVGIVLGSLLVVAGGATAGILTARAINSSAQTVEVVIDPASKDKAEISEFKTNESGDKVGTVKAKDQNTLLTGVKVTIGNDLLVENSDYTATPSNDAMQYNVVIFKKALQEHKGSIKIHPEFSELAVITFDSNGGSVVSSMKVKKGEKIPSAPSCSREDHELEGWYDNDGNKFIFGEQGTAITKDLILHAKWNIKETTVEQGLKYVLNNARDGYEVCCSDKTKLPAYVKIPEKYNNLPVTGLYVGDIMLKANFTSIENTSLDAIGHLDISGPFSDCLNLVEIELPDTITYIPEYSFRNCYLLKNIKLGNRITAIGYNAFEYCCSLKEINLTNNLLEIESQAFEYCSSLTSISIPDSVINVGEGAFYSCTSLKNVKLSKSMTSISYHCFDNCKALEAIALPSSITYIDEDALYNTSLKSVTFEDNICGWIDSDDNPITSTSQFINCVKSKGEPVSKMSLTCYLDEECKNQVPGLNFQYLGKENDTLMSSVSLGNIDELESGDLFIPSKVYYPNEKTGIPYEFKVIKVSSSKSGLRANADITSITIPSTIRTISSLAFRGLSALKAVMFDYTEAGTIDLIAIGDRAFAECYLLEQFNSTESGVLNLPNGLISLGINCFYDARFNSAIIPETLVDLKFTNKFGNPVSAFAGMNITKFSVDPNNIYYMNSDDDNSSLYSKQIDKYGDAICEQLLCASNVETFLIDKDATSINNAAFINSTILKNLAIPKNIKNVYNSLNIYALNKDGEETPTLDTIEVATDNENYISDDGVLYTKNKEGKADTLIKYPYAKVLDSYIIPATVKELAPYSLAYINKLGSVVFDSSNSVETISKYTFLLSSIEGIAFAKSSIWIPEIEEGQEEPKEPAFISSTSDPAYNLKMLKSVFNFYTLTKYNK